MNARTKIRRNTLYPLLLILTLGTLLFGCNEKKKEPPPQPKLTYAIYVPHCSDNIVKEKIISKAVPVIQKHIKNKHFTNIQLSNIKEDTSDISEIACSATIDILLGNKIIAKTDTIIYQVLPLASSQNRTMVIDYSIYFFVDQLVPLMDVLTIEQ